MHSHAHICIHNCTRCVCVCVCLNKVMASCCGHTAKWAELQFRWSRALSPIQFLPLRESSRADGFHLVGKTRAVEQTQLEMTVLPLWSWRPPSDGQGGQHGKVHGKGVTLSTPCYPTTHLPLSVAPIMPTGALSLGSIWGIPGCHFHLWMPPLNALLSAPHHPHSQSLGTRAPLHKDIHIVPAATTPLFCGFPFTNQGQRTGTMREPLTMRTGTHSARGSAGQDQMNPPRKNLAFSCSLPGLLCSLPITQSPSPGLPGPCRL